MGLELWMILFFNQQLAIQAHINYHSACATQTTHKYALYTRCPSGGNGKRPSTVFKNWKCNKFIRRYLYGYSELAFSISEHFTQKWLGGNHLSFVKPLLSYIFLKVLTTEEAGRKLEVYYLNSEQNGSSLNITKSSFHKLPFRTELRKISLMCAINGSTVVLKLS